MRRRAPGARKDELLGKYQLFELDYTAKQNGWPALAPERDDAFSVAGFEARKWSYQFPTPLRILNNDVVATLYYTVAIE
jgi:hypothetical protein